MSDAYASPPSILIDVLPRPNDRTRAFARDVALVAGFALLTAVLAQVRINLAFTPVPITGQTLGVLLAGTVIGWKRGALSMALYWAIGIVAPVAWYSDDASGTSISAGWELATGATAGYFAGFIVAAAVVGALAERGQDRSFSTSIPAMLTGTVVVYLFGVAWLAHSLDIPVFGGDTSAVSLGLTPFLAGDLLKVLIAGVAAPAAWAAVRR